MRYKLLWAALGLLVFAAACAPTLSVTPPTSSLRVVAVESFLADIAQNVAGKRVRVETLLALGSDPHTFEPTPQDVKKIADSAVLIVNGAGLEEFLAKLLRNAGSHATIIEASHGLTSRALKFGEPRDANNSIDPHFWLDPTRAVKYVENIRDGLTQADPEGAATYQTNASAYISKLRALDEKIQQIVSALPPEKRKLVTDHDTLGYYADRYGFEIVGMLTPSFSAADATSARQTVALIDQIRATQVKAIFLEQGANPKLAEQIARDTGVKLVTGLYTHSLSDAQGPAPTYLQMLEYDTRLIVQALHDA